MMNYFNDLTGIGDSDAVQVTEKMTRLPDMKAKFVILSNFNIEVTANYVNKATGGNLAEETGNEVFWGFRGIPANQLFMGKSTEMLPINNLNQISVRTRPGKTIMLYITWII